MPAKPNSRNWNDVQTAIAVVSLVTTLGMWNLFATPAKAKTTQAQEPVVPPTGPPVTPEPALMPQVKVMFTQTVSQAVTNPQPEKKKKRKNKDNNNNGGGNGGGGSVTQTTTS